MYSILLRIPYKLQELSNTGYPIKYVNQLLLLSRLRKLDDQLLKIVEKMPVIYNVEEDTLYNRGKAHGHKKGLSTGISIIKYHVSGKSPKQISEQLDLTVEEVINIIQQFEDKS